MRNVWCIALALLTFVCVCVCVCSNELKKEEEGTNVEYGWRQTHGSRQNVVWGMERGREAQRAKRSAGDK